MKRTGLWNNLERWITPATVLAEWQEVLGAEFALARTFLRGTDEYAGECPCNQRPCCGCEHEVIHHAPDRIVAACRCDERECRTFTVRREDILIHALDGRKLCEAIREAGGFEAPPDLNAEMKGARGTWVVGTYGELRSPVYLTIRQKEAEFLAEMEALMNAQREPFIVLAPTDRHWTPTVQSTLQRQRCAFIALGRHLIINGPGRFKKARSLATLLRHFEKALSPSTAFAMMEADSGATGKILVAGRLQYRPAFEDVWFGNEHYNLRTREKARSCIRYLVEQQAFTKAAARHLEREIDPYVRSKCGLPPAPRSEVKIHHYFTDRARKLEKLRKALIHAAGRNGRFYLKVE